MKETARRLYFMGSLTGLAGLIVSEIKYTFPDIQLLTVTSTICYLIFGAAYIWGTDEK